MTEVHSTPIAYGIGKKSLSNNVQNCKKKKTSINYNETTMTGHVGRINRLRFLSKQSPESSFCVSCSSDSTVRLFNFSKFEDEKQAVMLLCFKHGHNADSDILDACLTPNGEKMLSVATDRSALVWDVSNGSVLKKYFGHQAKVNCIDVKPDGFVCATGSDDSTIKLWDLRSSSCIQTLSKTFKDSVTGVSIDSNCIVGSSVDGSLRTFDVRMNKVYTAQGIVPLGSLACSEEYLLCTSLSKHDAKMHVFDRKSSLKVVHQEFALQLNFQLSLQCDVRNEFVGMGSEDGIVRVVNLNTGKVEFMVRMTKKPVLAFSFHPTSRKLAYADISGSSINVHTY